MEQEYRTVAGMGIINLKYPVRILRLDLCGLPSVQPQGSFY